MDGLSRLMLPIVIGIIILFASCSIAGDQVEDTGKVLIKAYFEEKRHSERLRKETKDKK